MNSSLQHVIPKKKLFYKIKKNYFNKRDYLCLIIQLFYYVNVYL